MLELEGLTKNFGGVKAVNAVNLTVKAGEVHGLIGPNGAGKTTLINLVSGLLKATSGTIRLDGQPLNGLSADRRARLGVGRTFQNLRIFPNLTVGQNIDVARSSVTDDDGAQALVEAAMERFDLTAKRSLPADELSYGHMRRLEIVRALALRPKILMLDEPAAGMNPAETEDLVAALAWIRERHPCSILVIDHDLKFIMTACDRITVLHMGAVLATGLPEDITKSPEVIAAYLGQAAA